MYIKNVSKVVTSVIDWRLGRCMHKLNNFIKTRKDRNQNDYNNNVVHKILCNNCDASYVAQIKGYRRQNPVTIIVKQISTD